MKKHGKRVSITLQITLLSLLMGFMVPALFGQPIQKVLNKRMAAYHYSVAFTGESFPSSALLTYPIRYFDYQNYNFLVKFMPCLTVDGRIIYPSSFYDVKVEDFPGGVEASFRYENTTITTRITPVLTGRDSKSWQGAACYEVKASPSREVIVLLGKGNTLNLYSEFATSFMNQDIVIPLDNPKRLNQKQITFESGKDRLHLLLTGSEVITLGELDGKPGQAYVRLSKGLGSILAAFSEDSRAMAQLSKLNGPSESKKVSGYYADLLQTSLETPDTVMNQAFSSALYNLEYSWLEPFGWGECLHHWLALWHMQVSAAADLIGQTDRSKSCILEHAHHLLKNGAVPQFMPNRTTKRDFGGSNQYWIWQVRHYLHCTADKDFAREVIPYVDTVIAQTLREYDPDGDYLASWGLQIGNQEDFVANPYNGSVPSMELYNIFMTRAELSDLLHDQAGARPWHEKAEFVLSRLRQELWLKDLGRFAFYKDPTGMVMLDGQYETYLYPIMYDLVDAYDQYTGLRHLRDRLTGDNGAVFLSNNFAWHATGIACTWGMQCGEAQQPWAAQGFSKSGLNNETWLPLKAMADWAQDINHRGSWPETGPEPTPAYFTPPAGLYLWAVTEALFGIRIHAPEGYVEISPSLPDHWPQAKLNLPDYQVSYARRGNDISYKLHSGKAIPLRVKWRLPVARIKTCTINGRDVPFQLMPGVGHMILSVDVPAQTESALHIVFDPVNYSVQVPHSVAVGEKLSVAVAGAIVNRITDRGGVLENISNISPNAFTGNVGRDLLNKYLPFNQLGILNFSRRTFFLDCVTPEGIPFIAAADLNLLPRFEATASGVKTDAAGNISLQLDIRNNTDQAYDREAALQVAGASMTFPLSLAPRAEKQLLIPLPGDFSPSSGDNCATITPSGEAPLELHIRFDGFIRKPVFVPLEIPDKDMIGDTLWNTLRVMPGFPHIFFTFTNYGWPKPMWALENVNEVKADQIPGLRFTLTGRHFVPVSHFSGHTSYQLELGGLNCKKLYLLVLPFVDNHNIFSSVARVTAYSGKEIVYTRTLDYPGDIDYWVPDKNPTSFASFREPRNNRYELLPLLTPEMKDWKEGRPPAFPESKWWSSSWPVVTGSCVMNVIEIELNKPVTLDHLMFESLGAMPAFGIVAATAELAQ